MIIHKNGNKGRSKILSPFQLNSIGCVLAAGGIIQVMFLRYNGRASYIPKAAKDMTIARDNPP